MINNEYLHLFLLPPLKSPDSHTQQPKEVWIRFSRFEGRSTLEVQSNMLRQLKALLVPIAPAVENAMLLQQKRCLNVHEYQVDSAAEKMQVDGEVRDPSCMRGCSLP